MLTAHRFRLLQSIRPGADDAPAPCLNFRVRDLRRRKSSASNLPRGRSSTQLLTEAGKYLSR